MSSAMPWVKLYTEMLDDTKIGRLPDGIKWRFVQLVLLAGECDADGCLINGEASLTVEEIAWRLRLDAEQITKDIDHLKKVGLLEQESDGLCVKNFAKRQGRSQEDKRAAWRARQAKKREADDKGGDDDSPPPVDAPSGPNVSHSVPEIVTRDSRVTHASREEESREEESREDKRESEAADAAAPTLTHTLPEGQIEVVSPKARTRKAKATKTPKARPEPNPLSAHPAIALVRSLTKRYPDASLYQDLVDVLGDEPDTVKATACHKEWIKRGYNPNAMTPFLEWYPHGMPQAKAAIAANGWPKREAESRLGKGMNW